MVAVSARLTGKASHHHEVSRKRVAKNGGRGFATSINWDNKVSDTDRRRVGHLKTTTSESSEKQGLSKQPI